MDNYNFPVEHVPRNVALSWFVSGIMSNGGFTYLLENSALLWDPGLAQSIEAYSEVGARDCAEALTRGMELLPGEILRQPLHDITMYYHTQVDERLKDEIDTLFWRCFIEGHLSSYIMNHLDQLPSFKLD